jgi:hypothetical protein
MTLHGQTIYCYPRTPSTTYLCARAFCFRSMIFGSNKREGVRRGLNVVTRYKSIQYIESAKFRVRDTIALLWFEVKCQIASRGRWLD